MCNFIVKFCHPPLLVFFTALLGFLVAGGDMEGTCVTSPSSSWASSSSATHVTSLSPVAQDIHQCTSIYNSTSRWKLHIAFPSIQGRASISFQALFDQGVIWDHPLFTYTALAVASFEFFSAQFTVQARKRHHNPSTWM